MPSHVVVPRAHGIASHMLLLGFRTAHRLSICLSGCLSSWPLPVTSPHVTAPSHIDTHTHTHARAAPLGSHPTGSGPAAAADVCVWCVRACVRVSSPSSNPNPKPPRARFLSTPSHSSTLDVGDEREIERESEPEPATGRKNK